MIRYGIIGSGMILLTWAAGSDWLPGRWTTGAALAVWLLPYMLFICLAAILSAGLNLVGRFAVAASTPILLNLAMIAALTAGLWLNADAARIVYWLCGGVLVGGGVLVAGGATWFSVNRFLRTQQDQLY